MSDIVERLRRTKLRNAFYKDESRCSINPDGFEAADEIERLRKERDEIVKSLELMKSAIRVGHPATVGDCDAIIQALKDET